MTYRELLELYKTGELELEQRKKVEKDIERQEAISDYLYEQEDIPELNDIFEEKAAAEKNNKRNDDIGDIDTKFIEMVNRSIRRAFRKMADYFSGGICADFICTILPSNDCIMFLL